MLADYRRGWKQHELENSILTARLNAVNEVIKRYNGGYLQPGLAIALISDITFQPLVADPPDLSRDE